MPIDDSDWQSDLEEKKQLKRDAANRFLEETLKNSDLRKSVLDNPSYAREAFQKWGQIILPEYVEVICVDPDRKMRNRLVVFVLPPPGTIVTKDLWKDWWRAAWEPY